MNMFSHQHQSVVCQSDLDWSDHKEKAFRLPCKISSFLTSLISSNIALRMMESFGQKISRPILLGKLFYATSDPISAIIQFAAACNRNQFCRPHEESPRKSRNGPNLSNLFCLSLHMHYNNGIVEFSVPLGCIA